MAFKSERLYNFFSIFMSNDLRINDKSSSFIELNLYSSPGNLSIVHLFNALTILSADNPVSQFKFKFGLKYSEFLILYWIILITSSAIKHTIKWDWYVLEFLHL